VANSGQFVDRDAPIRLGDIRMSAFDRQAAQRHVDAGVALADMMVRTSRRIRGAFAAIGNAFRGAIPH
jgi:hypothetical protein